MGKFAKNYPLWKKNKHNKLIHNRKNITIMKQLNIYRMFLKIVTIANMTHIDGKNITIKSYKGQRDNTRTSVWIWPHQGAIEKKG